MRVEIDQSGRIEFTGTDTILAYSDDKQYAIQLDEIVINIKFEGREKDVKNMLLDYIRKIDPKFPKHKILFRRITKESRAHKLALSVFRDVVKENKVITTKEIEEMSKE
jgi:hypothetical protein